MRQIIYIALLLCSFRVSADNIAIGEWRSHQDFGHAFKVAQLGDTIYCATYTGLFYFIRSTGVVTPLSKINGFSDINVRSMGYSKKYHDVFLGYENTNIDILHNGKILNLQDIYQYNRIAGAKSLNGFFFNEQYCYIAASFGIVQYNIERNEITDDYSEIWPTDGSTVEVKSIAFFNDSIYAATPRGLIGAPLNDNVTLRDYTKWKIIIDKVDCNALYVFKNKLWLGTNTNINPLRYYDHVQWNNYTTDTALHKVTALESNDNFLLVNAAGNNLVLIDTAFQFVNKGEPCPSALIDENNNVWIANVFFGLLKKDVNNQLSFYKCNGPASSTSTQIYNSKDEIFVAHGGYDLHFAATYNKSGVSIYGGSYWRSLNSASGTKTFGNFWDVTGVAVDPNNPSKRYFSSFGYGVAEYNANDVLVDTLGVYNSPLRGNIDNSDTIPLSKSIGDVKVGNIVFDNNGIMWISNFLAKTPLIARKGNKFFKYEVSSSSSKKDIISVTPYEDYGQIWMRRAFSGGIVIYYYGSSIEDRRDDKVFELGTSKGTGNLPDNSVNCIVKDKQGNMWVGTNNGVTVFYPPTDPSKQPQDATPPWVDNGKESGYLLNLQTINCIAVDGADRKWIGTRKGVYVTNEDGTQILYNFTTKNSPLASDNILSIGINGSNGEIFFGTEAGIISYRANATEANDDFTDVYAFPNPVRPGYTGPIAIKGLTDNTSVKITDITGNMVWETISHGGLVTWDGRNFSGQLANSGVYLVLMSNADGSKTNITKILIVR